MGVVKAGILIQVISNMFSRTKDRLIQTQTDISVNMIKYNSRAFVRALNLFINSENDQRY